VSPDRGIRPTDPSSRYTHIAERMADTQKKACLSCRQRKLKCDKQQPCANCVTRSVDCKEQVLAPATRGIKRTHDDSDPIPNILIRLEYVEAYINAQKIQSQHSSLGSAKQVVQNAPQNSAPTPGASTRAPSTGAPTPATTVHTSSTAKNTARNIQAVTSEFGVPLGPLTLNDNILASSLRKSDHSCYVRTASPITLSRHHLTILLPCPRSDIQKSL
jgi:hypothetical protein